MSHSEHGESSEQSTPEGPRSADLLNADEEPRTGGRRITAKRVAGPLRFEVWDADGERTCTNVSELPIWAVKQLVKGYSAESDVDDSAFTNPYDWLEALLASPDRSDFSYSTWASSDGRIRVIKPEGPPRYVVIDNDIEHEYANLDQVPHLDQFQPALLEAAEREMEALKRQERQDAVQRRLDEMLNASETLSRHSMAPDHFAPVSIGKTPANEASSAGQSPTIVSSHPTVPRETVSITDAEVSLDDETSSDPQTPIAERAQLVTDALSKAVDVLNDIEAEVRARTAVARRLVVEEKAHRARTDQAAAIASATEVQNQAITAYISRMLGERTAELEARERTIEDRLSRVQNEARERERAARNRDLILAVPGALIVGIAAILVMHFVFHIG